jgi:resuscitation-promoting factor RpfB
VKNVQMDRQPAGRRIGRAGAGEFAAVTGAAGAGALVLALMVSGAATAPATGPVAAPRSTPATPTTPAATSTTTTATATPTPEEVTVSLTEQVAIPFASTTVDDPALLKGVKVVRTSGRAGVKTVTWLVRTHGGVEVGRSISGEQVTTPAVDEVVAVGSAVPAPPPPAKTTAPPAPKSTPTTKTSPPPATGDCDPNYAGACVPIARDVDCSSGNGDGPAYVVGPVRVIGRDIYELDRDKNGIGCENG